MTKKEKYLFFLFFLEKFQIKGLLKSKAFFEFLCSSSLVSVVIKIYFILSMTYYIPIYLHLIIFNIYIIKLVCFE